jgi:hypothetical protein
MAHKVGTHAGLLQQNDLRLQHPDWIQPNGQCPMCDSYETRLIQLLSIPAESNNDTVAVSHIQILRHPKNSSAAIFS